jgi:hypothetical protein
MSKSHNSHGVFGLLAEFDTPEALLRATAAVRADGYRRIDAFTPFPVEGLPEALGLRFTFVAPITLAGGILGAIGGFWLQYWISAVDYAVNVGGRPLNSWPAFVPATFELTVLGAALGALVGAVVLNGLPMPYHPLFNVPRFALATQSCFFLCVESRDPIFDRAKTAELLASLGAHEVLDVPF